MVALAGATGSGKSSLFNALVGAEVATVGARRPTTSKPTAAVWGTESATELLDWLAVGRRHRVEPGSTETPGDQPGSLEGLVLLDLPDFDSRVLAHRREADRILALVDVFVWVTDPQKYADALLHDDYLAALSTHDAVTVVVLNQSDRLTPDGVRQVTQDLVRLGERDGIKGLQVIATSARTGAGVDDLRLRLATAVAGQDAARHRLAADIRPVAGRLRAGVADTEPALGDPAEPSWWTRCRAPPASPSSSTPSSATTGRRRGRAQAGRSPGGSAPCGPTRSSAFAWARARRTAGTPARSCFRVSPPRTCAVCSGVPRCRRPHRLPVPRSSWPRAGSATAPGRAFPSRGPRRPRTPPPRPGRSWPTRWTRRSSAPRCGRATRSGGPSSATRSGSSQRRQSLGLVWLLVLGVVGWLRLPEIETPRLGPLPYPFLLLAGGLLFGVLLAALARALARVGARRRAELIQHRLRESVSRVASEHIVAPVREVLRRHAATREQLDRARA